MDATQFPSPEPDETLERYTVRCARIAKGKMDPDDFNDTVWAMWNRYRGPTDEEKVALKKFSPDKYQHVPGVCVFAEHETTTANGEHRKYDLKELAKIVRGNNERISDVGAFPAISDGHTSNPDDPNPRDPDIVGYAGNYRLGLIGRKNPRWAIFQDEYQLKEAAPILRKRPRRSVELWSFKDGRAHFDPIAAIGAEAPRLPLPQRFSTFSHQDATVERYTFSGGGYTAPAAGNTFVQSMGGSKPPNKSKTKSTYAAEAAQPQEQGADPMPRLAPEDLQQIVAAISETPQFQFLTALVDTFETPEALIDSLQGGGDLGGDDLEGGDEDLSDLDDLLGDEPEPEATPEEGPPGGGSPAGMPPGPPPEGEEAPLPEKRSMKKTNDAIVERYTQLQRSHQEALKDMSSMHNRIASLEKTNANHARRARINDLAKRFPNFVDVDEETERCLYSEKANMSSQEFDKHIADVERYAQKAQSASVYIPSGDAPRHEETSPEKYAMSQQVNQLAVKIATQKRSKGEEIDYETARQLAREQLAKS